MALIDTLFSWGEALARIAVFTLACTCTFADFYNLVHEREVNHPWQTWLLWAILLASYGAFTT